MVNAVDPRVDELNEMLLHLKQNLPGKTVIAMRKLGLELVDIATCEHSAVVSNLVADYAIALAGVTQGEAIIERKGPVPEYNPNRDVLLLGSINRAKRKSEQLEAAITALVAIKADE